jgi:hypothetical protein
LAAYAVCLQQDRILLARYTVTIDTALELARGKPPGGHVEPVSPGGLLRL